MASVVEGKPVKAIEGFLRNIHVNSIELQHKTRTIWAKNPEYSLDIDKCTPIDVNVEIVI